MLSLTVHFLNADRRQTHHLARRAGGPGLPLHRRQARVAPRPRGARLRHDLHDGRLLWAPRGGVGARHVRDHGPRVGAADPRRGPRRAGGDVPPRAGHRQGAREAGADCDARARGPADRGPELFDRWVEAVWVVWGWFGLGWVDGWLAVGLQLDSDRAVLALFAAPRLSLPPRFLTTAHPTHPPRHRPQALRGQLAGPHARGAHRARPVRRGLVPDGARVHGRVRAVPAAPRAPARLAVCHEPREAARDRLPRRAPRGARRQGVCRRRSFLVTNVSLARSSSLASFSSRALSIPKHRILSARPFRSAHPSPTLLATGDRLLGQHLRSTRVRNPPSPPLHLRRDRAPGAHARAPRLQDEPRREHGLPVEGGSAGFVPPFRHSV